MQLCSKKLIRNFVRLLRKGDRLLHDLHDCCREPAWTLEYFIEPGPMGWGDLEKKSSLTKLFTPQGNKESVLLKMVSSTTFFIEENM